MNDVKKWQEEFRAYIKGMLLLRDEYRGIMEYIEGVPTIEPEPSTEKQEILNYLDTTLHPIISPEHWDVYSELYDMISTLPSAQSEIIRCKDCRWGREACGNIECFVDSNIPPEYHGYEWFCPNGERRTG